ncbi:MAG TPA: histidine phosphatase family protein [Xanthobacteraceae bacterium]|nr:histidine phosphatase family protein [Xanthobacteraceae bacterium]
MLLRHAKTERTAPSGRDRDRKLILRGHADAPIIGAYMARHGFIPELASVSPATRAQETWALVAPYFIKEPQMRTDPRIYNATVENLAAVVSEAGKARSLLLVGHNPGLHDFARNLITTDEIRAHQDVYEKLPTSGLVVIDLPIDDWALLHRQSGRLERFIYPSLLGGEPE